MEEKEFCLSDKRKKIEKKLVELIPKLGSGIVNRIIQQIKDQDKEFIKQVKIFFCPNHPKPCGVCKNCKAIDKLAGKELI